MLNKTLFQEYRVPSQFIPSAGLNVYHKQHETGEEPIKNGLVRLIHTNNQIPLYVFATDPTHQ